MTTSEKVSSYIAAPSHAWSTLIRRSVEAWHSLAQNGHPIDQEILQECTHALQSCPSMDDFLGGASKPFMFWFFQRREAYLSQGTMAKWSRHNLDDYILLPAADGFVQRTKCIFISHFWQSKDHPDSEGKRLRLQQEDLQSQSWSYVWIDWTCIPQSPRNKNEEAYLLRTLQAVPGIIRNCRFVSSYPPFEARMWILYEVAECILTSSDNILPPQDMKEFVDHIKEMLRVGVPSTLKKYGYRCSCDRDEELLTSSLEMLVLLRRLRISSDEAKELLDSVAWAAGTEVTFSDTVKGRAVLSRFEGRLILGGQCYTFTPFPRWDERQCFPNLEAESSWGWGSIKGWLG